MTIHQLPGAALYNELVEFHRTWGETDVADLNQLDLWEELKEILERHKPASMGRYEDRITTTVQAAADFEAARAGFSAYEERFGEGAPSRAEAQADQ